MQTNAIAPVEMDVSRLRLFPAERLAQLWGCVGAYELRVSVQLDDPHLRVFQDNVARFDDQQPPASR